MTKNLVILITGCLLSLLSGLVLWQYSEGSLLRSNSAIPASTIRDDGNGVFAAPLPLVNRAPVYVHPKAALLEDGQLLQVRSSSSQRVREEMEGAYSIGKKQLWISIADSTDPRTNGRTYELRLPARVPVWLLVLACITMTFGIALTLRGLSGEWFWQSLAAKCSTPTHADHEWGLDALRGIAVAMVLWLHLTVLPESWRSWGKGGVDVFFVMSGYLVSGLLFKEWQNTGLVNVPRFLVRRAFRIYPAHWFMLIATVIIAAVIGRPAVSWYRFFSDMFYVQNYLTGSEFWAASIWPHTWTLAVEEHFYIILPILFAISASRTRSRNIRGILYFSIAIAVACPLMRVYYENRGFYVQTYILSHLRIDSLMFGVALRYWRESHTQSFHRTALKMRWVGFGMIVLFYAPVEALEKLHSSSVVGHHLDYVVGGSLLLALTGWQSSGSGRWAAPLCYLGRHSYSVYLWHVPVSYYLRQSQSPATSFADGLSFTVFYLLGTILLGVVMHRIIELPALRMRDKWVPSRRQTLVTPPEPVKGLLTNV